MLENKSKSQQQKGYNILGVNIYKGYLIFGKIKKANCDILAITGV